MEHSLVDTAGMQAGGHTSPLTFLAPPPPPVYLEQALEQVGFCLIPWQLHELLQHLNDAAITQPLKYQMVDVLLQQHRRGGEGRVSDCLPACLPE